MCNTVFCVKLSVNPWSHGFMGGLPVHVPVGHGSSFLKTHIARVSTISRLGRGCRWVRKEATGLS